MSRTVEIEAPAKVNLFLRVLGRRPDGFHDIETLFQAISLADRVAVTVEEGADERPIELDVDGPASGGRRSGAPPVHLKIDGPDLGPIESNLAYRAARRFQEQTGLDVPVRIELVKRIPAGAGLGGGSSDAAAVLKALAALTGFENAEALHAMALELGSDVPFFLAGSPLALGAGRGGRLTELRPLPEAHLVLGLPPVRMPTGEAYSALAAAREEAPAPSGRHEAGPSTVPTSWAEVRALAENDFEPVVARRHQEIRASLDELRAEGASVTLLSGSGAASFGLFEGRLEAKRAADRLERRHPWSFFVATTRTRVPMPTVVR